MSATTPKNFPSLFLTILLQKGSQCGFCTPGIVMAVYAYQRSHPHATQEELVASMDGNLCRCTGYRPIIDALKKLAPACDGSKSETPAGICPSTGKPCACDQSTKAAVQVNPSAEFIFPPSLMLRSPAALKLQNSDCTWWRPLSLAQLLLLKHQYPEAKIIVGNTEVGVEQKFRYAKYAHLISPQLVSQLHQWKVEADAVVIGAAVPLADVNSRFQALIEKMPEHQTQSMAAVVYQLKWFAGNQIRNAACIGGNIATASPISDLNPVWIATGATVQLRSSSRGKRIVALRNFFVAYRKTVMEPDEVIVSIRLPHSREHEYVRAFKQARRKEDDIAIVTCCFRVLLDGGSPSAVIKDAGIAFGGMAAKSVAAEKAEQCLIGRSLTALNSLDLVLKELALDVPLSPEAPGGMAGFRRTLTSSFFFKFYHYVLSRIDPTNAVIARDAFEDAHHHVVKGTQVYTDLNETSNPVSYPVAHMAARKQGIRRLSLLHFHPFSCRSSYYSCTF